jgi:DNA repair protein RecO (recombination protein O)
LTLYRDEGVVLRTMRLGEADRIVTMLCRDRGKVRAVAKGVRRTTSRFGARLEPLSHVSLFCWQGRELDIVKQAEVIDTFRAVREDLSRISKAFSMLEVADRVSVERNASPRLYELLVRALGFLANDDAVLVVPAFFLKVLAVEGSAQMLDACAICGSDAELVAFSMQEGGALCRDCRRGRPMSGAALEMMRAMVDGGLGRVIGEKAGPVTGEVGELVNEAMEAHLERQLRSIRTGPGVW